MPSLKSLLTAACASCFAASITAAPPELTDALGHPLRDEAGALLNYGPDLLPDPSAGTLTPFNNPAPAPTSRAAKAVTFTAPPVGDGGEGFWNYSVFGTAIGASEIVIGTLGGQTEIYIGGSAKGGFYGNDFWQVLRHNNGQYQSVFASNQLPSGLKRLALGNVTGDARPEIVAALENGTILYYDQETRKEKARIQTATGLTNMRVADLDGNGSLEVVVLTTSALSVYSPTGTLLWTVANAGGNDLAIAQMDGDSALEIAVTSGKVIDAGTRTVQWTRAEGFGAKLKTCDFDNDGREELIAAESWYYINTYDVDLQVPKWTLRMSHDVASIEIANVDGDSAPELLVGDGQWGDIHVYNLATQVEKWNVRNPEHGVTDVAAGDVDGDGVTEILWGAGASSTGSDIFYVASAATHLIEWESIHLDGPFRSPVIGDLDGDGKAELVTATWESDAGYDSGRILVFDAETRTLRGISAPIGGNSSWEGLREIKLCDLEKDGKQEIVVAADWLYDGIVEIYGFAAGQFSLKWTNPDRPDGSPFNQVEVLDVDKDGNLEIVGANTVSHTGSEGVFITVYDVATKAREWRSPAIASGFSGIAQMVVGDIDADGRPEAVVLVKGTKVEVYDLALRQQEATIAGNFTSVALRAGGGFLVGDATGQIIPFTKQGIAYAAGTAWRASDVAIDGITQGEFDQQLWVSTGGRYYRYDSPTTLAWASADFGDTASRSVAFYRDAESLIMYGATIGAVNAFRPRTPVEAPVIAVESKGGLNEAYLGSEASLRFVRTGLMTTAVTIRFRLGGTASAADYTVTGATLVTPASPGNDAVWSVSLPANANSVEVPLRGIDDLVGEATETISATLEASGSYLTSSTNPASVEIADNESVVSVEVLDSEASEAVGTDSLNIGLFRLTRTGPINKPMTVFFRLEGNATNGRDYRAVRGAATFNPGRATSEVKIVPYADKTAEATETVQMRLLSGGRYLVHPEQNVGAIEIIDDEPVVSINGYSSPLNPLQAIASLKLQRDVASYSLSVPLLFVWVGEDGTVVESVRTARFLRGQTESVLDLPLPLPKGPRAGRVGVRLISHPRFHLGSNDTIEFPVQ